MAKRARDFTEDSDTHPSKKPRVEARLGFLDLCDDVIAEVASHLVRPAHYMALLIASPRLACILTRPALKRTMDNRYFTPWREVMSDGSNLAAVEWQTTELCLAAVTRSFSALQHVKEQTPEICLAAMRTCGMAIRYVKKQTPEICHAAVTNDAWALEYVKEQTTELCLIAVNREAATLTWVKNQTPEICLAAVSRCGAVLGFVRVQTREICIAAVNDRRSCAWLVWPEFQSALPV